MTMPGDGALMVKLAMTSWMILRLFCWRPQIGADRRHLRDRLLGLRLEVALRLIERALRLLEVDLRLALDRRRLVLRLLLGELLLLERELGGAHVFARLREVERRVELRGREVGLRLLQVERHIGELAPQPAARSSSAMTSPSFTTVPSGTIDEIFA